MLAHARHLLAPRTTQYIKDTASVFVGLCCLFKTRHTREVVEVTLSVSEFEKLLNRSIRSEVASEGKYKNV